MLALEILFRINYRFEARPLSFEEIRQAIDAGQPIIAVRVYPLGGAHANVIVGYNAIKKTLVVAEPTFGQENIEPYNSFVGNLLSGIWVGAFVITSRPPDRQMCHWVCDEGGCHNLVCRFNPGESRETALREE